jgi:hypothetical protein
VCSVLEEEFGEIPLLYEEQNGVPRAQRLKQEISVRFVRGASVTQYMFASVTQYMFVTTC